MSRISKAATGSMRPQRFVPSLISEIDAVRADYFTSGANTRVHHSPDAGTKAEIAASWTQFGISTQAFLRCGVSFGPDMLLRTARARPRLPPSSNFPFLAGFTQNQGRPHSQQRLCLQSGVGRQSSRNPTNIFSWYCHTGRSLGPRCTYNRVRQVRGPAKLFEYARSAALKIISLLPSISEKWIPVFERSCSTNKIERITIRRNHPPHSRGALCTLLKQPDSNKP